LLACCLLLVALDERGVVAPVVELTTVLLGREALLLETLAHEALLTLTRLLRLLGGHSGGEVICP
jgi:hypothetical protein